MPELVIAEVILLPADKSSIVESKEAITADNIAKYRVGKEVIEKVSRKLEGMGFKVIQAGPVSLSISGDKVLFENTFQTKLESRSKGITGNKSQGYYEVTAPIKVPSDLSDGIADVVLPTPPEFYP